ncbi:MAG: hypothetical protein L6R39_001261 [Caloplaca ligustica]|nr:MAG: hypothetical protein L6R39_001261 [Caloplaca ligustica]
MTSYIIVGAGIFGSSTAFHLKRQLPEASIILIDRSEYPCPVAASHDINKIVRADYESLFYCELALKALHRWKTDELFRKWFHPSGLLNITDKDSQVIETIVDNFKKLHVEYVPERLAPQDIAAEFNGVFSDMNLRPSDKLLFNRLAGIAEADKALEATTKASVELGVQYVADPVSKLLIKDGVCNGVQTRSGKYLTAANIVLSTGAYTAKLIADSAPDQPELQVGTRITARAVCTGSLELNSKQIEEFSEVPAVVHHSGKDQGI